ncbi:hypothetical protein HU200_020386 [Digitaria exilis]|uniref:Uncharacterized protein n=1 Tax=Digitaria exilis TaxID=1010633 RepID=A0A835KFT1_9POAL|nr:hypothetical protein HU200_020386 [Digitaria exilis]
MTTLAFAVRRAPTPRETKRLSDIDDQEALRGLLPGDDMVTRTFTFARRDLAEIKAKCLRDAATGFEVLTAVLWRARTAALEVSPDEEVCLAIICNIRGIPDRWLLRERGLALVGGDHRRGAAGQLAGLRRGDGAGGEGGRDSGTRVIVRWELNRCFGRSSVMVRLVVGGSPPGARGTIRARSSVWACGETPGVLGHGGHELSEADAVADGVVVANAKTKPPQSNRVT